MSAKEIYLKNKKDFDFGLKFLGVSLFFSVLFSGVGVLLGVWDDVLTLFYALGLVLALFLFKKKINCELGALRGQWKWLVGALLLPFLYVGGTFLISKYVFSLQVGSLDFVFGWTVLFVILFLLLESFLEELVWREFLVKKFKKLGWVKMNVFIGVLWSMWHWPAILIGNYQVTPPLLLGLLVFTINVILLSFIFCKCRVNTAGLLAPILAHASHNFVYRYLDETFVVGESGLMLMFVLFALVYFTGFWKE